MGRSNRCAPLVLLAWAWAMAMGVYGVHATQFRALRSSSSRVAPVYAYEIVNIYPHDPAAFTQGLAYRNGSLFESTGLNGRSTVRELDLETGRVLRSRALSQEHFAEGLALWKDRLIQLTWRSRRAFIYDVGSFERIGEFEYPGEGWGLTSDGTQLIMSDGSAALRFIDPMTFDESARVVVRDGDERVLGLNELEFIRNRVHANVLGDDHLAIIDRHSGMVIAWIDLHGLLTEEERRRADVLNGVAYDPDGDRLFVTGKLWPKLFEIRISNRI